MARSFSSHRKDQEYSTISSASPLWLNRWFSFLEWSPIYYENFHVFVLLHNTSLSLSTHNSGNRTQYFGFTRNLREWQLFSSTLGICGKSHLPRECDTMSAAYMGACYNKTWMNANPSWVYQPGPKRKRKHADLFHPDVSGLTMELHSYKPFINWKDC